MRATCSLMIGMLLFAAAATGARAQESFQITLLHAQNHDIEDTLGQDEAIRKSLTRLFGYQRYHVLGTAASPMPEAGTVTLQPARSFEFILRHDPERKQRFRYELSQEQEKILEGCYVPKRGTPLIIRGPQYGRGNLILVVDCDPE